MQVLAHSTTHTGELLVVDNNSSDNTAQIAKDAGAVVIFEPINQIARARNAGAQAANGEALIFIDSDTCISAELLANVLDLLLTDKVVGGGSAIEPDRAVTGNALRGLNFWNWLSRKTNLAAGCFIFCRQDAFNAVKGFNTRVYAGEEIYLSRRLKRWGRRRGMSFKILTDHPVMTSVRKLDWYSPMQLARQAMLVLIPGAIYSKRLCRTWYQRR